MYSNALNSFLVLLFHLDFPIKLLTFIYSIICRMITYLTNNNNKNQSAYLDVLDIHNNNNKSITEFNQKRKGSNLSKIRAIISDQLTAPTTLERVTAYLTVANSQPMLLADAFSSTLYGYCHFETDVKIETEMGNICWVLFISLFWL